MNVLPEIERKRLERAMGAARIVAGLLTFFGGVFLPSIGEGYVFVIGTLLVAYGVVTLRLGPTSVGLPARSRLNTAVTAVDATFALIALVLFSLDPSWAIAPMVVPLVIVSAFRVGPRGAFGAAAVNTVGYLAGTGIRSWAFGYPVVWVELALLVVLTWMTAFLVTAILVEAETLRAARRDLYEPLLAAQSRLGELIVVSEGGYAAYFSEGVTEFTGLTANELKGTALRELFPDLAMQNGERSDHAAAEVRQYESALARRDGTTVHVEINITDLPPLHDLQRSLIVARDVTQRKEARAELERLTIHDALTGLPNKALLGDRLARVLRVSVESDRPAVLYVDLDRFKDVNDAFGHAGGDAVLAAVGARLGAAMEPGDSVGRYEGDGFVVVLCDGGDRPATRATELLDVLAGGIELNGKPVHVEATVGIALAPEHGSDPETLIRCAEAAMYRAKRMVTPVGIYLPDDDRRGGDRMALLDDLRHAIERGQLWIAYQPIVSMATRKVVSVEALLRWQHPTRGLIPPMEFIPLAEDSGLIRRIGLWALDEAVRTCASWPCGGPGVSVNLSVRNLRMAELKDAIVRTLERWRLPRGALTVEITESIVMEDPDHMIGLLRELEAIGVRGSVDDYGTGYSSLAYLLRLPVRELKIDRAFVADMATNPQSEMIVRSTIDLAHELGLLVVAEGIEDQRAWDALQALGCDLAQGYFIARPMPSDAVRQWLQDREAGADAVLVPG